jgi:CRISPR-associated protein Csb2
MLALHVALLTDRYAATRYNDRTRAEWPPHPARVYSALVEALHAGRDRDADAVAPEEARALDELATWGPPQILSAGASARRVMTHYVPVNDTDQVGGSFGKAEAKLAEAEAALASSMELLAGADGTTRKKAETAVENAAGTRKKARAVLAASIQAATQPGSRGGTPEGANKLLPWNRGRQPRTFPAAVPEHPEITYLWPDAGPSEAVIAALTAVAERVVRLGHSSSFVHVRVAASFTAHPDEPRSLRVPDDDGEEVLRVPGAGQRLALDDAYARHAGDLPGRLMPGAFQRYRVVVPGQVVGATLRSGGRWVAYRVAGGAHMPAHAAVPLAEAVRGAVIAHASEPVHPLLCGHAPDGPLLTEHLAVIPLPFVGHPHADGVIRGFALSLPAAAPADADRALLIALSRWESSPSTLPMTDAMAAEDTPRVEVGVSPALRFLAERIVDDAEALTTLQRARWARPASRWATVTPIALDGECSPFNHPAGAERRKAHRTAEKIIRRAVVRMLTVMGGPAIDPEAIRIELNFDSPLVGAAHLGRVGVYQRAGHARPRRLVHAVISLPFAVRGPLLLGAGRHFGLGLCLPLDDASEDPS